MKQELIEKMLKLQQEMLKNIKIKKYDNVADGYDYYKILYCKKICNTLKNLGHMQHDMEESINAIIFTLKDINNDIITENEAFYNDFAIRRFEQEFSDLELSHLHIEDTIYKNAKKMQLQMQQKIEADFIPQINAMIHKLNSTPSNNQEINILKSIESKLYDIAYIENKFGKVFCLMRQHLRDKFNECKNAVDKIFHQANSDITNNVSLDEMKNIANMKAIHNLEVENKGYNEIVHDIDSIVIGNYIDEKTAQKMLVEQKKAFDTINIKKFDDENDFHAEYFFAIYCQKLYTILTTSDHSLSMSENEMDDKISELKKINSDLMNSEIETISLNCADYLLQFYFPGIYKQLEEDFAEEEYIAKEDFYSEDEDMIETGNIASHNDTCNHS